MPRFDDKYLWDSIERSTCAPRCHQHFSGSTFQTGTSQRYNRAGVRTRSLRPGCLRRMPSSFHLHPCCGSRPRTLLATHAQHARTQSASSSSGSFSRQLGPQHKRNKTSEKDSHEFAAFSQPTRESHPPLVFWHCWLATGRALGLLKLRIGNPQMFFLWETFGWQSRNWSNL